MRGRGKATATAGDKSTFYSTRVEEQEDRDANDSGGSQESIGEDHLSSDATNLSSDEDLESERSGANSYNTLLQSLSASVASRPTQRKKRKIDIEDSEERPPFEDHQENPEKRDDFEKTSNNGIDDQSDPDEANAPEEIEEEVEEELEDGEFSRFFVDWKSLTVVVTVEDSFSTHFADPDESRLAKQILNVKNSRLQTAKLVLASGLSCLLTGPELPEIDQNQLRVSPQSMEDLKVDLSRYRPMNVLTSYSSSRSFRSPQKIFFLCLTVITEILQTQFSSMRTFYT